MKSLGQTRIWLIPLTLVVTISIILHTNFNNFGERANHSARCKAQDINECNLLILSGIDHGDALAVDYNNRGYAYSKKKQFQSAISDFDAALNIKPDFAIAYNNRGDVSCYTDNYEAAISDYNKALSIDPKYAKALNNRGLAYYELHLFDKALADFDAAINIRNDFSEAYLNRGATKNAAGNSKGAESDFAIATILRSKEIPDK